MGRSLRFSSNSFDAISTCNEKWIQVDIVEEGEALKVSVSDSGCGITKEMQDSIMDPFFTTKPVGKGTGLGLSISYGIMESHEASLCLDRSSPHTKFDLLFNLRHETLRSAA